MTRFIPHSAAGLWALLAAILLSAPATRAAEPAGGGRCAAVKAGGPIRAATRKLLETPDIRAPELRRANALLSARCFEQVDEVLQAYASAHPDDYRIFFIHARYAWITDQRSRAEAMATTATHQHPDFTSMKVLLASMAIDDHDYVRAQRLLDQVEAAHPDDLWAYLDRLRIEADVMPSPKLARALRDIVANPDFPPNARQQAADIAGNLRGTTPAERDVLFTLQMEDGATADDCVLARHAIERIEFRGDPKGGAAELEHYLERSQFCLATPLIRTVLAEAYLLQAAGPPSSPPEIVERLRNQALAVLQGDLTPLAERVALRTNLSAVIPLLGNDYDLSDVDDVGRTLLCTAVVTLNAPMVEAVLARGADPSAPCEGRSPVGYLVLDLSTAHVTERQQIVRRLLEHGAAPEGIETCSKPEHVACKNVLLPVLQEFANRRPAVRS
jgi:hypothetical protein